VQINNAGALGADSGLVFTGTGNNGKLTVGGGRIFMDATTGSAPKDNVAIGGSSGGLPFSAVGFAGFLNVSVGAGNLSAITTGDRNVVCGSYSLYSLTTGSSNLAIGNNTLTELTTGVRNTAMGNGAGGGITTGNDNIFINRGAVNGTLSCQIVIGGTSDGASSTVIGFDGASNESPTTTTRFIGNTLTWGSGVSSVNNRTSLVQSATTSAKTITLPNATGKLPVYTDTPVAGKVLTATDASGAATWETPSGGTPADGSITTAKIADGAVTAAKFATSTANADLSREVFRLNDDEITDSINWQPSCVAKIAAQTNPLRILIAGDSLSTGLSTPPNMMPVGVIGLSRTSAVTNVTSPTDFTNVWLAPYHIIGVGGSAVYHAGGQGAATAVPIMANTLMYAYISEPGAGSFDIAVSSDGGSTYGTATTVNASNTSQVGVATVLTISNSNNPRYIARINNVTTGSVKIIAIGLFQSTGVGVIHLKSLANLAGIDIVNYGKIPDAIFTPIWTALAPDLVVAHYADIPEEWQDQKLGLTSVVTNGTSTITFAAYPPTTYAGGNAYLPYPQVGDYITGTNIPPGTRIFTHTKNTQTATITVNATGSGTSTASIQGGFDAFYDRCKAIKSATDFVIFSQNPLYAPVLSGHDRWDTSIPYVAGKRVTMYDADGTLTTNYGTASEAVYVCTANHTSGASTKPESGASWATVWTKDLLDPNSIISGTARCQKQALAQRNWATSNKESFVNGLGMFRNYGEAVAAGLMATPDAIHPSSLGYAFKQIMFWSKIPLSRLQLGTLGSFLPNDPASPSSHPLGFPGGNYPTSVAALAELARPLLLGGTSSNLAFADRNAPNAGGNNLSIFNTDSELNVGGTSITGKSSFSGWHPVANGRMLGGRGSFFWNIGGAGARLEYAEKSANYSIVATDYTINVTANSPTITLPNSLALNSSTGSFTNASAGAMGKIYIIKNSGIGLVTVATTSSQLIDGSAPGTLATGALIKVQSTGSGWITVP
jgi:hypothetical protein